MAEFFSVRPTPDSCFGTIIAFGQSDLEKVLDSLEARADLLLSALIAANGLLVLPGLGAITEQPELLLRLSRLFGTEIEDYRHTLSTRNLVHPAVPQILVLANQPPSNRQPPTQPEPALTENGELPVQFPHRSGWHTDQSFRRPPPDVSLFYAVTPSSRGTGQTLYASGTAAYQALNDELKIRISNLYGIHALPWTGRSETAVRSGDQPVALLPHQQPQRQPLVRYHPVTGEPSLFLCEDGQMDWVEGPIADMEPGPDGEGAALLYTLMRHFTERRFVYMHDWDEGDLVIHDNRNVIHSATWFDTENEIRHMWRTTVMGNPGREYQDEAPSWIPAAGVEPAEGLADQTNASGK